MGALHLQLVTLLTAAVSAYGVKSKELPLRPPQFLSNLRNRPKFSSPPAAAQQKIASRNAPKKKIGIRVVFKNTG
eukprot:3145872-Prymnesium_polylepis.2